MVADDAKKPSLAAPLLDSDAEKAPELELGPPTTAGEAAAILGLAFPMILTGLIMYTRSLISMYFLGRIGPLALAGGSLAIGFANITGYSVLSGLAMGMEPICGQAFGAGRHGILGATLQRAILLLLLVAAPIAALWANARPLLLYCRQQEDIAATAAAFLVALLPDLLLHCFLHPLRVYLRAQRINAPLTGCAIVVILFHYPLNHLLVDVLGLGIQGVALASVLANLNLLLLLGGYILYFGMHRRTGGFVPSSDALRGWPELISLAAPSCLSVCLEWWWYEIMVLSCGLLIDPQSTVASMGVLIQTTSLIYIFPSSLSLGISTRVSNSLGAGRADRASRAAGVGMILAFALGALACTFAVAVRFQWARLFTKDPAIIALTAAVLPVLGACELGNCPQTAGCGVLRGSARPKLGAKINFVAFYVVGGIFAHGFVSYGMDFKGLWLALLAAQGACVLLMLPAVLRTNWDAQVKLAMQRTGGPAVEDVEQWTEAVKNWETPAATENGSAGETKCSN